MTLVRILDAKFWMVLSLLAGGLGCAADKRQAPPAAEPVRDVSIVVAQRATVPDYVEAVGTVRAAETSQLASQMMGTIVSVSAHEGDHVRRGQVLAVLDAAQPAAALDRATAGATAADKELVAAESDLRLADATLKRYQGLFERKSVSPQEFDEVQSRFAAAQARRDAVLAGRSSAQAAVAQARTGMDYTRIRAPFDGVVVAKLADAGSLASPGMPLFVVENPTRFRLEATIDESDLGLVRLGEAVPVAIDALSGGNVEARVSQIVPAADPSSRTFLVKLDLPARPDLRSGLFGRAHFRRGQRDTLTIPNSALVQRGQLQGVYVVGPDQVANLRFVTVGKPSGAGLEVLAGLDPGERLVADAAGRDLAGRKIEVR